VKKRVIYIAPWQTSFVLKDLQFLRNHFEILCPDHNWKSVLAIPFSFLLQLLYLLKHIRKTHAVVVMFGGYWSFLPSLVAKLFGRRCFILLGGMDCVSFPSLNYGSLRKPVQRWFIKHSYKWTTHLLPVDETLAKSSNSFAISGKSVLQGFRNHFPTIKTPYTVIPNGFETIELAEKTRIPNSFVTISTVDNAMRYQLKGLDMVVELAEKLPTCQFTVIGCQHSLVPNSLPENIRFFGYLPSEQFQQYLFESEFYIQFSLSEGFPNAVGEAMMHGCIPLVSNVGAMPTMIGDSGFVFNSKDVNDISQKIQEKIIALSADEKKQLSNMAISKVKNEFPIERRERELLAMIQ
jgi:glycosyltransferase involved in cell wall biosynthesis